MFLQLLTTHPKYYFWVVVIVIFSICVHELAHGYAAESQGDDTPSATGHMTLNPVVHLGWTSIVFLFISGMAWGAMPVNPSKFRSREWGDVIVSAAGPLSNLALGCAFTVFLMIATRVQFISIEFLFLAAQMNFALCFFNFLPIPPLDGFCIASKFFPGLRTVEGTHYGLFALMILYTSGIGGALYYASAFLINSMVGSSFALF